MKTDVSIHFTIKDQSIESIAQKLGDWSDNNQELAPFNAIEQKSCIV